MPHFVKSLGIFYRLVVRVTPVFGIRKFNHQIQSVHLQHSVFKRTGWLNGI